MASISVFGNVGRDAELRQTSGGSSVLSFPLADTVGFGDKEHAVWYRCSVFGKRAEKLSGMIGKGDKLFVSGSLDLNTYTGNDGQQRSSLELNVSDLKFAGGGVKKQDTVPQQAKPQAPQGNQMGGFDDDIPF